MNETIVVKLTLDQEHVLRASSYDTYFSTEEYKRMTGIPEARLCYTLESVSKLFFTSKSYNKQHVSYKINSNKPIQGVKTDFNSCATHTWYEFHWLVCNDIQTAIQNGTATTITEISELFQIPINLAEKAMEVAKIQGKGWSNFDKGERHESWTATINALKRDAIWRLPMLDTIYLRDTEEDKLRYRAGKFIFAIPRIPTTAQIRTCPIIHNEMYRGRKPIAEAKPHWIIQEESHLGSNTWRNVAGAVSLSEKDARDALAEFGRGEGYSMTNSYSYRIKHYME